ncbi:MAG: hypothetical protein KDE48_17690 [Anaerolineales bacterium]|nr:hypothetical protein [Anaerolineales bacterium]
MLRKIKRTMLQNPIVLAAPLQTRLEDRPLTVTILSPAGFRLDTVQKVALSMLLVPAVTVFFASLISAQWTLFFITGFLLLLVGLILWIIKLRAQMVWKVTYYRDAVEVIDGRYGKPTHWTEPLSAFTGLKRDFGMIRRGGQYTPNQRVYGLLLAHPDPFKSVLLHASYDEIEDDTVAYYTAQLHL